jgi:hypothetical protein
MVPLHQAKIHCAFRTNIVLNDKKFGNGAVALSEHMVVLAKKSMVGHSFSHLKSFHLLDLATFSTSSETHCKATFRTAPERSTFSLSSEGVLRFARILVRNYFVITRQFPQQLRFQFRPHDAEAFPRFDPKMSPSQVFQFTYNAQCSYFNATYEHAVTRFFHAQVLAGNGIPDLTRLPLRLMEVNFGHPLELRPLFAALMFNPLVHGVVCSRLARPDIVAAIAPLVLGNAALKIVDLHECSVQAGIPELSNAIRQNADSEVAFWDLSENPFDDVTPFCASLAASRADVFYLNLSNTGLSADASTWLFKSLLSNKHLWSLKYLKLAGARLSPDAADLFGQWLNKLSTHNRLQLRSLDFGNVGGSYDQLLNHIGAWAPPLQELFLDRAAFKPTVFDELCGIVRNTQTLRLLSLRGATAAPEQIVELIDVVAKNPGIADFALDLSRTGLSGKKIPPVLQAFGANGCKKWTRIALDENGLTGADIESIVVALRAQPNLRELSLGGNFDRKDRRLAVGLPDLLTIPALDTLLLRGTKSSFLGEAVLPLLEALKRNQTLRAIDVSFNRIGDAGLAALTALVSENRVLNEIHADGSKPTQPEPFFDFLAALGGEANDRIHICPFPMEDSYDLVQSLSGAKRTQMFERFSATQKAAQDRLYINQSAKGITSDLSLRRIPELDELIDIVTLAVHDRLEGVKINQHGGLASAFGLPMPHRDEGEDQTVGAIESAAGGVGTDYGLGQSGNTVVVEETVVDAEGFQTLAFNSLCIRRPDARGRSLATEEGGAQPPPAAASTFEPSFLAPSEFALGAAPSQFEDFE